MNIILWILQILLALAFIMVGYTHGFNSEQAKSRQGMQWLGEVPKGLLTFIGVSEILGGLGLILPAATNSLSWLTPLAGALLAVVMAILLGKIVAIIFHILRREYPNIVVNVILLALAAFVAYGRFVLVPL
jgi:uncharacterized membrane protein YphA (DoxX/SURF4 family)